MPTANERKALWFLAIVALSGSAVRLARSTAVPPSSTETQALERQLQRVDSARASRDDRRGKKSGRERHASRVAKTEAATDASPPGGSGRTSLIDLDRASAEEIETLPGIGPTLAQRIVANRDSAGAFGAVGALCDVRGVGPKLAERIRPLVTFTGPRRPLSDACGAPEKAPRKRRGS